jgi:carbonic anhydrase
MPSPAAMDPDPIHPGRSRIPVLARLTSGLRWDLPASLVVFLVAVPLSLGIAAASGAPVMAGLIAAAVGGIVAGSLGGAPLQVSGPAAGLTVIVAGLIEQFGWPVTCAITVAAGVLQVLLGMARVGRVALAIAPVVVHAMLAGIGIIIVLQQLHVMLGAEAGEAALQNILALPDSLAAVDPQAAFLGAVVIALLAGWKYMPAAIRRVPGPLVAVVAATLLSLPFNSDVDRITFDGSLLDALSLPHLPQGEWTAIAVGVVTIALVASVESLLSAVAVDKMHHGERTDFNRELLGQGAANVTSGMLGGLPVTGVIVRSATNLEAGARTRKSAILHGIWVLVFSLLLAGVIQLVPEAVLAGLLIMIGIRLVKVADFQTARLTGDLAVYAATLLTVVFVNLLAGVLIGLALAVVLVVWRVVRASIHAEPLGGAAEGRWRVVIDGSCTFLSLPRLSKVLAAVPPAARVTVELDVDYLDHPVHDTLEAWRVRHVNNGGSVEFEETGTATLHAAQAGTPARGSSRSALRGGFAPWRSWQRNSAPLAAEAAGHLPAPVRSVLNGVDSYHRRHAHLLRPHVQELSTFPGSRHAVHHLRRLPAGAQPDHQQRPGGFVHGPERGQRSGERPPRTVGRGIPEVRPRRAFGHVGGGLRPLRLRRHDRPARRTCRGPGRRRPGGTLPGRVLAGPRPAEPGVVPCGPPGPGCCRAGRVRRGGPAGHGQRCRPARAAATARQPAGRRPER